MECIAHILFYYCKIRWKGQLPDDFLESKIIRENIVRRLENMAI